MLFRLEDLGKLDLPMKRLNTLRPRRKMLPGPPQLLIRLDIASVQPAREALRTPRRFASRSRGFLAPKNAATAASPDQRTGFSASSAFPSFCSSSR